MRVVTYTIIYHDIPISNHFTKAGYVIRSQSNRVTLKRKKTNKIWNISNSKKTFHHFVFPAIFEAIYISNGYADYLWFPYAFPLTDCQGSSHPIKRFLTGIKLRHSSDTINRWTPWIMFHTHIRDIHQHFTAIMSWSAYSNIINYRHGPSHKEMIWYGRSVNSR